MPNSVLKIEDLTVSYNSGFRKEKVALNNVSFELKKGDILGLLGPNGAGKTTLIKSILNLIQIKNGKVYIFGKPSFSTDAKRRMGYMPEVANYYWFLTPNEILRMFGRLCGIGAKALSARIGYVLELVGLLADKDRAIKDFSKGMQERLNIAQAILHDPELLILDEPFSGLDPLGRIHARNIFKKLKDEGKTILLSSHELSEAELICDWLCIMKDGAVLKYGPVKTLLAEQAQHSLERYFLSIIGAR